MPRIRNTIYGPHAQATVLEERRRNTRALAYVSIAAPMAGDSAATRARLEDIRREVALKTGEFGRIPLKSGELKAYRAEIQRLRYEDWQNQRRTT